jgi:hypothetical protein
MRESRDELVRLVERELQQPVPAGAHTLVARVRERYGKAVRAVLFYGSCLRQADDSSSLLDLYVLVDSYRHAYDDLTLSTLNRLLPPNVFYLEAEIGERKVRSKYAVLALEDLSRLTSPKTFEPYFWARFAQPCALVYAADDEVRRQVAEALAGAIVTFVRQGVGILGEEFNSDELWTETLRGTYRAELRAERSDVVAELHAKAADRYETATRLAFELLPFDASVLPAGEHAQFRVRMTARERRRARLIWALRRLHAKSRFLLRIGRNALIFEGGVDYVLWKIQRHSGIDIDHSWRQKRHPLLALGAEAWRLYRAGAFR